MEEGSFQLRRVMLAAQANRNSQRKRLILEEEEPIQEVEKLPTDATSAINWVINLLSVLTMRRQDREMLI